jgi:hypothetical protein
MGKAGDAMAIMPHCVVCGFSSGAEVVGTVEFADYTGPSCRVNSDGSPAIGWCNSLGVTAPEGVGLFCRDHLKAAEKLRRLRSDEAVARLNARSEGPGGFRARLRSLLR